MSTSSQNPEARQPEPLSAPGAKFIAMVSPSNEGHVITVWRDPHPKGHVPVNLTTIRGSVWDPAAADHLLLTTYGYVTAPGSRWQRMDDGRYGIRLIRAEEPKAPKPPAPLTPERLAEIRSTLLGEWLAGGWRVRSAPSDGERDQYEVYAPSSAVPIATFPHWAESVAVFLADANEAVPELLAEVARLTARVAELEAAAAAGLRSLSAFIFDTTDPGADALGAQWLLQKVMPQADDPFAEPNRYRDGILREAAKRQRAFIDSDDYVCDDWEAAYDVVDLIDPDEQTAAAPAAPRLPLPGLTDLLAADFEAMRTALLAKHHPEQAHDFLDADPDTAYPLPGVAHPKTTTEVTA